MAERADDRTPRRGRWLLLAVLLGAVGVWAVRNRRAAAVDGPEQWPLPRPAQPDLGVPQRQPRAQSQEPAPAAAARPSPTRRAVAVPAATAPRAPADRPSPRPRKPAAPEKAADPMSESVFSLPDGSAPDPAYTIKGNAASMLFHLPTSPYYKRTKAEVWFRTPDDARAAGFTEWTRKKRAGD